MQIGKNIYYEKATGHIIVDTGERQGSVVETTTEQDFQSYQALADRVPETVGKISLEFGQYSEDFRNSSGYRVNLDTLELEFDYTEPSELPVYQKPLTEEVEELKQVIDIMLGGEAVE